MAAKSKSGDLDALLRLLPHRPPFLMLDRVLEVDDHRALTLKNVSANDPFFVGHFPGRPIVPGVLIVEALAQSAAVLALSIVTKADARKFFVLTGIDKVRLRRQVVPGDQLRMEVLLLKHRRPLWRMRGVARVDGELAAEAEISAMELKEPVL